MQGLKKTVSDECHAYLVNVSDVDIDISGAQYSDPQRAVDSPKRLGGRFTVHVGGCCGYPPCI